MNIRALLDEIEFTCIQGSLETSIESLSTDSREVDEKTGFIAVKGLTLDGHDFMDAVIAAGCKVIFVERENDLQGHWSTNSDITVVKIPKGQKIQALMASRLYGNPFEKFSLVGVTGTNGKTSVTQMLANCLETLGKSCGVLGTTGNRIGETYYPTTNTTLEAVKLQRFFKKMENANVDVGVMEVSSHALKEDRVAETIYDFGVFTNLTEDHLDFHDNMEDYYQSKKLLFDRVKKYSVLNLEDDYGKKIFHDLLMQGKPAYSYGLTDQADFYAQIHEMTAQGTHITAYFPGEQVDLFIPIPGKIYVYNAMAVISVLYLMGYEMEDLERSIRVLKPVQGRLESISHEMEGSIIVDFAHTPDALEKAIEVCREFTSGRLITIFGCGGDRDRLKRPVMGHIASEKSDYVIVTSDNPRTEVPESIIESILSGIEPEQMNKVQQEVDRRKAIQLGVEMLKNGDTLLIAGKGHETYQLIGKEKHHFDDREEAIAATQRKKL